MARQFSETDDLFGASGGHLLTEDNYENFPGETAVDGDFYSTPFNKESEGNNRHEEFNLPLTCPGENVDPWWCDPDIFERENSPLLVENEKLLDRASGVIGSSTQGYGATDQPEKVLGPVLRATNPTIEIGAKIPNEKIQKYKGDMTSSSVSQGQAILQAPEVAQLGSQDVTKIKTMLIKQQEENESLQQQIQQLSVQLTTLQTPKTTSIA